MSGSSPQPFNPCSLEENEQIPAKIWELLRRNKKFCRLVQRVRKLDAIERCNQNETGKYHGPAWQKSWELVERTNEQHPFAGIALQWLVPEPVFHCHIATWPRGKKWKQRGVFITRFLRVGEGFTPNVRDKSWAWRNPDKLDVGGHPITRGPEVYWTKSRFKRLRSRVNPILEWRRYRWPFTVGHSWKDAPAQFRRAFHFIWRSKFDCRPTNQITKDRRDSPMPHEVTFFHDWDLAYSQKSGHITRDDLYQIIRFNELGSDYRVFAVPKTVLTKASADTMGKWVSDELKKGSDLYGELLKSRLLNEGEMFGTASEWADWLSHHTSIPGHPEKTTHFYRRCRYMDSLVALVFPGFDLAQLLAPPAHRARGRKYVRK